MKKRYLTLLLIVWCCICKAQNIPLNQQVQKRFNEITLNSDTQVYTAFRSVDWLEYKGFFTKDKTELADSAFGISAGTPNGYFLKNLGTNNWVQANGPKSVFAIDPYFDASFGKEKEQSSSIYQLSAGLRAQGTVNDKLSYSLAYVYTSQRFPNYLDSFIAGKQGANLGLGYGPGMGKGTLGSNGAYGFSQVTGNITYLPSQHFLVSIGNGKNFVGDGYRSLLLSDNAANYPYLRLQARYWRLTYDVIYSEMDDPRYLVNGTDQRKYDIMHVLGVNLSKKLQLGFYEAVIFYNRDTTIHRGFDVQYINPVILMRPEEFAIGSPDNAFLGFTGKYHVYKKGFLYGQVAIDDLHLTESIQNHAQHFGNKYALQLGIWNEDIFNVKGLDWRFEWNGVRPYTYDHGFDKPGINYTHDNQPLADPFGANFHEFISIFQFSKQRWYGSLENLFTVRGEQPAGLWYPIGDDLWGGDPDVPKPGTNTLPPVYGSTTLQGVKNYYFYNQLTAGYLINPRNRLGIEFSAAYRHHSADGGTSNSDLFFTVGIKTGVYNFYNDF